MPRVDSDIKLDFKDVLVRPKRSTLRSRSEVSWTISLAGQSRGPAPHVHTLMLLTHAKFEYTTHSRLTEEHDH